MNQLIINQITQTEFIIQIYKMWKLTREEIKSNYKPIPDYYYSYDCRESLDSCYNEACLASNPNCFSRKVKEQIKITLDLLNQQLRKEKKQELELEKL